MRKVTVDKAKITTEDQIKPLSTFKDIATHYLRTRFIWHLVPIIPYQYFKIFDDGRDYWFLLIKCIRLYDGIQLFDIQAIMKYIRKIRDEYLKKLIENYPEMANDTILKESDHKTIQILFV